MVVIDGIRDIVKDINNPEESTTAINNIMRWTDVYKVHILAVLHQNPGKETGNKLRGHIGTEAMNKAETVISVVKSDSDEHAIVNGDFMRRETFKSFGLKYDKETNLPVVVELEPEQKSKKHKVSDVPDEEYSDILKRMFNMQNQYTKTVFCDKVQQLLLLRQWNISRNESRNIVDYLDDKGMIASEKIQNKIMIVKV